MADRMVHTCNPTIQEARQNDEFEASLSYMASFIAA
jgi:hypothetical protein